MAAPIASSSGSLSIELLTCPLCTSTLTEQGHGLVCGNNHSFDRAKQGYYNLLPVQHKASKSPGDDKAMVQARQQFLNLNYYQPFSDALNQLIISHCKDKSTSSTLPLRILDAGCGEGYYLRQLQQALTESSTDQVAFQLAAIDISKQAVLATSKQSKDALCLVASAAKAPIKSASIDTIYSLFTPLNGQELHRLLREDGILITATAGENHLLELRQRLYREVTQKPANTALQLAEMFQQVEQQRVSFTFTLPTTEAIQQLLQMTPHYWRATPTAKAELEQLDSLTVTADFTIDLFKPMKKAIS